MDYNDLYQWKVTLSKAAVVFQLWQFKVVGAPFITQNFFLKKNLVFTSFSS